MATPIPNNRCRFRLGEILACTGGQLVAGAVSEVEGLCLDTRQITGGEVFVALVGERVDGHDYLPQARANGAALAIVERDVELPEGLAVVRVPSSGDALAALAASHLARWRHASPDRRVLALTGSAGKTTTKECIAALLRGAVGDAAVVATIGNLNNLIGVPMMLLTLGDEARLAVIEMGTNAVGEIPRLARLVRPDMGLVNLIAAAHTEGIGGIDAIAREKNSLFDELPASGSVALGNADDPRVMAGMMRANAARRVSYGHAEGASYRVLARRPTEDLRSMVELQRPDGSRLEATIPLLGSVGATTFAAGVAAAECLLERRLGREEVEASLAQVVQQSAGRMQPRRGPGDMLVIDDSYNANPASMRASLATAAELAKHLGRRLVVVLGEMRELGEESLEAHRSLGASLASHDAALVIGVAGDARHIVAEVEGALFAEDAEEAAAMARTRCQPRDVVLVKGSRGVTTEVVVRALVAAPTGSGAPGKSTEGHCAAGGAP